MHAENRPGIGTVWSACVEPLCVLVRCAAVLFIDGQFHYTDGIPSQSIMDKFNARNDRLMSAAGMFVSICKVGAVRQITTLEILAIAIGLSTFQSELKGRKVVVWSDNKGAEGATRKGSAKAWDHCRLVHDIWLHALQHSIHLWIERVPSHDNIADSPTRGAYLLMEKLRELGQGRWMQPVVASVYLTGESVLA